MSDVNNSGSCGIQDLNEVLKDTDMTSTEKTETLSKIKNKIGTHGFVKIDKYIEVKSRVVNFTITSQTITESIGVVVTQGTATGTLMVALSGDVVTVKVKQDNDSLVEFNATTDLVVGSTTITATNITTAEYVKVYYGICRKKIKQSRYKKFKKKNENTSAKFDNAVIDRVLDYDDLTQTTEDDNTGALDNKSKLQKMVDLTNSKTTVDSTNEKYAGKDKDIHITVDGRDPTDINKSYKIGNFSGWEKDPIDSGKMKYDSNKVGAGTDANGTDANTTYKKHKTMYWKKNTATGQDSFNGGVYKKKKKKNSNDTSVGMNETALDNIMATHLDNMKNDMDQDSPLLEVGETDNSLDAYVLFKLKKKPKNATEIL